MTFGMRRQETQYDESNTPDNESNIVDNESSTAEIVRFQQGGLNKVSVKLDMSTKNKVINRLNHLTEVVFKKSLSEEQKIDLLKENNEMISVLNSLPILVDDATTKCLIECETNDGQGDEFASGRGRV